jgi:hypothetical protein
MDLSNNELYLEEIDENALNLLFANEFIESGRY